MLGKARLLIVICVLLLVPGLPGVAQTDSEPVLSSTVIAIDGLALIHRSGWHGDVTEPLTVGESVSAEDVIVPLDLARVTVMCGDGSTSVIFQLSASPTCALISQSDLDIPPDALSGSRGVYGAPQIISPLGRIATRRPTFRWVPVDQATSYNLRITTVGTDSKVREVWAQAGLTATEMTYPTDAAPLDAGAYTITVRAFADAQEIAQAALIDETIVISESDVKALQREFDRRGTSINDQSVSLYMMARLYASSELYTDAIENLESALGIADKADWMLVDAQQLQGLAASPTPYLLLGYWYGTLGVATFSQRYYTAALDVADSVGKPTVAAQARIALSEFQPRQRMRYCMVKPAIDSLIAIADSDALLSEAQKIAEDAEKLLGYTPTCL